MYFSSFNCYQDQWLTIKSLDLGSDCEMNYLEISTATQDLIKLCGKIENYLLTSSNRVEMKYLGFHLIEHQYIVKLKIENVEKIFGVTMEYTRKKSPFGSSVMQTKFSFDRIHAIPPVYPIKGPNSA